MKDIENMIEKIVERVINEEINTKVKNITEEVSQEIDEMEEYYEVAKQRKSERMAKKESKEGDGTKKCEACGQEICECGSELSEEEVEESSAFVLAADAARDAGEKEFEFPKGSGKMHQVTLKADIKNESKKQTLQLTEDEMIELIERIVNEQKLEGVSSQKTAMKTSKKDNDDYIKSVTKKMKDYLKDASEGEYETDPKSFPKGNGDKKKEKMMYTPSDSVEEYIDQIANSGGMENLDYDQIKPDEEWLDLNLVGSSKTGNNPEWANAEETETGKKVKRRKDLNVLAKLKKQSYEKAPQPVYDLAGDKTHNEKMAGIDLSESKKQDKNKEKVNENIERMKTLFSHNYKTQ